MSGFLNIIILLSAIQGFIVSILLFLRKKNKQPYRLLATLILLMALASINIYLEHTGVFESSIGLRILAAIVPLVIVMPLGPLIYFYIKSGLDPSFKLTRKHHVQFYTIIIDIIPQIAAIIFITGVYAGIINNNSRPWGLFIDKYNMYADIPRWISLTTYILLSYKYIKTANGLNEVEETKKTYQTKWLKQFIGVFLGFQVIWLIYLIPYCIPAYSNWLLDQVDWYPIYIPLAIMIYWLGIKGYFFSDFVSGIEKNNKRPSRELPDGIIQQTKQLLTHVMEKEKLYLNPALSLDLVAIHIGISAKNISTVLNQHLKKSFNDWVNTYRVEEFKQKIQSGGLEKLTISGIASDCGFNSQATFQRIFKQHLGMTPSAYLKQLSLTT